MRRSSGAIIAPLMVALGLAGVGSAAFVFQSSTPMIPLWGVLGPVLGLVLLLVVWVVRTVRDSVVEIKVLQSNVLGLRMDLQECASNIEQLRDWKHNELAPKVQVLQLDVVVIKTELDRLDRQLDELRGRRRDV